MVVARLLSSDFPSENPRAQTRTSHTRAVIFKLKKNQRMGVYVLPTIVKKENNKVSEVREDGMPESNSINALNDLIFLDELKDSLIEIADKELDLSFFTKPNDSSYGNQENVNISFNPKEVLKNINLIKDAFNKRENEFIRPYTYLGIYDKNENQLRQAFIVFEEGKLFRKKKTQRWGQLNASEEKASFQWFDDENEKWGGSIDLTKEKPKLYELTYEGEKKIKGRELNYTLKKSRFYDLIKPEIENIET
ncbi:hypothetical protein, partial [Bizionia argentinensis]